VQGRREFRMILFVINGKKIKAAPGTTVREAALKANIDIPALCFMKNYPHYTSCMICVVKDTKTGKLIPSCTALVQKDMNIDTTSEEVLDARRTTLELLLSEHTGDCEAPCRRACPAYMNIPQMLRRTSGEDFEQALITVLEYIPLPALLSRICPAPCEKICRRKDHDQPVAIQALIRMLAEQTTKKSRVRQRQSVGGHNIAVCGAGPAGLSAAFYLLLKGHSVSIFEKAGRACDTICRELKAELNITRAMEQETARLKTLGSVFHFNTELGKDITPNELVKDFDAVVMAVGRQKPEFWEALRFECSDKGVAADPHTYATRKKKVFACGSALSHIKLAANAVNRGRECALAVDSFLRTGKAFINPRQFDSHIGRLKPGEIKEYLNLSSSLRGIASRQQKNLILTSVQSVKQARRCLHCDCRKASSCTLRAYSTQYRVKASRYKSAERNPIRIISSHPDVIYEPGKCIKCARCVRITTAKKEVLGLTFIGRGFNVEVGVPFNQTLSKALTHTAKACVQACPTGALAFKR